VNGPSGRCQVTSATVGTRKRPNVWYSPESPRPGGVDDRLADEARAAGRGGPEHAPLPVDLELERRLGFPIVVGDAQLVGRGCLPGEARPLVEGERPPRKFCEAAQGLALVRRRTPRPGDRDDAEELGRQGPLATPSASPRWGTRS
jgi:hypothetical protein